MRRKLLDELRRQGIADERVLEAMNQLPRHYFLDRAFVKQAYENIAFQIGEGQTISQPYTVAAQTSLLQVAKGQRVLEIGTGSGYQTAVLCILGAKVYSIERQRNLFERSRKLLTELGYRPQLFYGDGYKGKPAFAPFDRILVTCGAPYIPGDLKIQLSPGGRLVIPVGEGEKQQMLVLTKDSEGVFTEEVHGEFRFVPMLQDKV
jgi:protein-L-isoaspartate(D-aspartate) O-methyltransferase